MSDIFLCLFVFSSGGYYNNHVMVVTNYGSNDMVGTKICSDQLFKRLFSTAWVTSDYILVYDSGNDTENSNYRPSDVRCFVLFICKQVVPIFKDHSIGGY